MKQENITSTGTRYLALGALALTLASVPAHADWVTVRPDGSTQTTKNAPDRGGDNDNRDDSYDGPGRLKATSNNRKRDNLSIYNPPNIDNRMRVGSPNNSFEPGRTRIDSSYSYVPQGYVIPQYAYPPTVIYPPSTTVIVPGAAYNVPIGPPTVTPNWANPNYNTQPYITSVPLGTTIYSSQTYPPYGYCPPPAYPAPAYGYPAYPSYGYPAYGYGYPNSNTTTTYGSVRIGGRRSGVTFGGSNTTSTNSYSVRVGRR